MVKNWEDFWTKSTLPKSMLVSLGLGQFLSLLITFTGFTSSLLANKGIDSPYSICFLYYLLLALVNVCILIHREATLKVKLHCSIMLAIADVLSKYLVIKAYQRISLTSVVLLDCWTIPCVLFLTCLFFKTKYGFQKLVGAAICVVGLITVVYPDLHPTYGSSGGDPLEGDLAIIAGATLYSISSVCEAVLVEEVDRVEFMAFLGYYGAILTYSLVPEYEHNELKSILSSPGAIFSVIGFSFAMFLLHSGVPFLLKNGGSKMLNLSLLASNMCAILIRIFVYHEKVEWIYFVAFAVVTLGLIVYWGGDEMESNNGEAVAIDEDGGEERCR